MHTSEVSAYTHMSIYMTQDTYTHMSIYMTQIFSISALF